MTRIEHPSFYLLDGLRLSLSPDSTDPADPIAAAAIHVHSCPICAAYVRGDTDCDPGFLAGQREVPAWVAQATLAPARAVPPTRSRRRFAFIWPTLSAATLGLLLVFALLRHDSRSPGSVSQDLAGAVREKGAPAVRVFVKRGTRVFAWDGVGPVLREDRLRFELHNAGLGYVSVASRPPDDQPPVVLYAGPLGDGVQLLPLSFRVDEDARSEIVSVIVAQRPIAPALHRLADDAFLGADPWRQILIFKKAKPE